MSTSGGEVRVRATIDRFFGSYRFLSNFWPVTIEFDGDLYPSVENAYQAAKFPAGLARAFMFSCTPAEAKRFARKAILGEQWHERKVAVMTKLVQQKFAPGGDLAQKLIDTGDAELIEGNSWGDRFWGVCNGEGENYLGRILMLIRSGLNAGVLNDGNQEQPREV